MRVSTPFLVAPLGFLASAANMIVNSVLAIYSHQFLGASTQEVGIIVSALFATSLLVKPPLGVFVKGLALELLVPVSYLFLSLGILGYVFAPDAVTMIGLRLFHGVWYAASYIPLITIASMATTSEKVTGSLTVFTTANGLGLVMGPMLATIIIPLAGVRETFLLGAALTAIGVVIGIELLRRRPIRSISGLASERLSARKMISVAFSRVVVVPSILILFFYIVHGLIVSYAPLLGSSKHLLTAEGITSLFFMFYVISTVSRIFIGRLLSVVSANILVSLSMLGSATGIVLIGLGDSLTLFVSGFILVSLGNAWIFTVLAIVIAQNTLVGNRSLANSVYLSYFDLAFLAGPLLGAAMVDALGIPLMLALSALFPISGVIINTMHERSGHRQIENVR